jgi:hypothetical protein
MDCKVLSTRERVCQYLGISKEVFYALVDEGLPVVKRAGQWFAHVDDIEGYFRFGSTDRKPADAPPSSEKRRGARTGKQS